MSVVETGHFARAADRRNITQSAFSRRVKSLELWVGTELLDRSQHPVSLTPAGRDFLPVAKEMIRLSYEARSRATEYARIADTGVTIACLHTLALFWVPSMIAELRSKLGALEASIVAETRTVEEYLESLFNGTSDFFVCYQHNAAPMDVDAQRFPSITIGRDRILPYVRRDDHALDFLSANGPPIHYLEYSGTSFMSRVVEHAVQSVPFKPRLRTVYRGTLAESLCTAAIQGLGLAWLPESVVANNPRADVLKCLSEDWQAPVDIVMFKAESNSRKIVSQVWDSLRTD